MDFSDEFLQGQRDCKAGVPHSPAQSEAYSRGYAAEYEKEQVLTEMTKNEHH